MNAKYIGNIKLKNKIIVSDPTFPSDFWGTAKIRLIPGGYDVFLSKYKDNYVLIVQLNHKNKKPELTIEFEENCHTNIYIDTGLLSVWNADEYDKFYNEDLFEEIKGRMDYYNSIFTYAKEVLISNNIIGTQPKRKHGAYPLYVAKNVDNKIYGFKVIF